MGIKKILCLGFMLLMMSGIVTGCSGSKVSDDAKKLYNEQAEVYKKKAGFLEKCFSKDKPTPGMSLAYPTSFFHLTEDEKEIYENVDFGEEMIKNMEKGKAIERDADKLKDAFPKNNFNVTESELDNLNNVFKEMKEKYQGFDYSIKSYE